MAAEEGPREQEYSKGASQGSTIGDEGTGPRTESIARQYNECRVQRDGRERGDEYETKNDSIT